LFSYALFSGNNKENLLEKNSAQYFRVWPTIFPDSGRNKETNQKATYMTRTVQHEEALHFAHVLQI